MVSKTKVILFLNKQVLYQALYRHEYKKQYEKEGRGGDEREEGEGNGQERDGRLAYNSVRTYVSALMALYESQRSRGLNTGSNPRGAGLKALMDSLLRTEYKRKKESYIDRAEGTVLDGYSIEDMKLITTGLWKQEKKPECYL